MRVPREISDSDISAGGDLDILINREDYAKVFQWLSSQGLREEWCPHPFRHPWRLRTPEFQRELTVDVYLKERWGWGVSVKDQPAPVTAIQARLMRAIFDKDNADYFLREFPVHDITDVLSPRRGTAIIERLWARRRLGLLRGMLWISGVVKVHWGDVTRYFLGRAANRIDTLRRRRGLEVGLLGIDGTGKSTLSTSLVQRLPLPTRRLYMGNDQFLTPMMRWAKSRAGHSRTIHFVCFHIEMAYRRILGSLWARRGYVVIYDRHPIERMRPGRGIKARLVRLIARLYAHSTDLNFWLDGPTDALVDRKPEHSHDQLECLRLKLADQIDQSNIVAKKIDTVAMDREATHQLVGQHIIEAYQARIFIWNLLKR